MSSTSNENHTVAIITGGARGIGKAIAMKLACKGIHTVLFDIDQQALTIAVEEMVGLGYSAQWSVVDISKPEETRKAVDAVFETHGTIDILVNNAGILSTANILEVDENEWNRVMDINVKGPVFMTQHVLTHMTAAKKGRIINISSLAGRNGGLKTGTAYSVSKAAVIGLTKRTARFAAEFGITVNSVAPGTAATDMVQGFSDKQMASLLKNIPMGRLTQPEEIAAAVEFLASDLACSITGVVLDVNGGMYF
ncbi:MAG: SDR family oxidoreductase [Sphaerochaetaceae bacterium]|nr:SDR family oxidoreductase [Sphaerochaetaceae bacterium]